VAGLPTTQAALAELDAARAQADDSIWAALARLDQESEAAHRAFLDYVHQGTRRSIRQLHTRYVEQTSSSDQAEKPPTTKLSTLFTWSSKHQWQERVAKFEQEWQQRDQALWADRRRAVREANWEAGEALRQLANDILRETPQFLKTTRRVVKDGQGQPAKEIITLQIDVQAMLKALEVADKLQSTAAGVEPPAQQINIGGLAPVAFMLVPPKPPQEDGDGG
jgi:hypothetical protein